MGPRFAVLLCLAFLSGCGSRDFSANDDEACRSKGLKPGNSEYIQCRETLFSQRAAQGGTYSRAAVIPIEGPINTICTTSDNVTSCHDQ